MSPPVLPFIRGFRTTHWTLIRAAGKNDAAGHEAREELCRDYWYPVYSYLRKLGYDHDAQDLTQSFFAHILERSWFARADPEKGQFRVFLMGSLRLFLNNARDRHLAAKRSGSFPHIALDTSDAESRYSQFSPTSIDPSLAFEIEWALAIVGNAIKRLELECAAAGKQEHFSLLKAYLKSEGDAAGYQAAAAAMEITVANVKVRVHRMRQRYGALLKEEIARTVATTDEIDGEMQHLRAVFANLMPA